jgi:hypothetical protein
MAPSRIKNPRHAGVIDYKLNEGSIASLIMSRAELNSNR